MTKEKVQSRSMSLTKDNPKHLENQEQLGDLGLDLGIGEPVVATGEPENTGGDGGLLSDGGLLGDVGSFGDVPDQKKENMPEIEDVVDDDNPGLNVPKIEEDAVESSEIFL